MGTIEARRGRALAGAGVVALVLAAALLALPGADAATDPVPPPVTDYATYPQPALIPEACGVDGPAVLVDTQFEVNGVTAPSLRDFDLQAGDLVTMTWAGFAPGCEGIGVSLSVKKTNLPFFDPQDNQQLLRPYDYCGPGGVPCGVGPDGRYRLSLAVPPVEVTCNFQFDAAIGPPLEIVGPEGSYYSTGTRVANGKPGGPNMLISASNGGIGDCEQAVTSIDKLWVIGGQAGTVPPVALAPGFAVVVESRSSQGEPLGSATCRYEPGFTCTYADPAGAPAADLPVTPQGTLEVVEQDPPAGFRVEPSGRFQLADRFVSCGASGCVLTVTNTDQPTPTTTVPPTTTPTSVSPTTAPPTTAGPGSDVGGTGAGNNPSTANTATGTLPATGSPSRAPVLLAYALLAVGALLLLESGRRRLRPALTQRGRSGA